MVSLKNATREVMILIDRGKMIFNLDVFVITVY